MGTIGILLDADVWRNVPRGKTGHEKLSFYNRAAKSQGLTLIYICLEKMRPDKGYAFGYKYNGGIYRFGKWPIPKVIHNRAMTPSSVTRKRLAQLKRISNVFNGCNRYSKYAIHQMLKGRFSGNLPETVNYSRSRLVEMMNRHNSLFVKPQSGSVGDGIVKLTRTNGANWKIQLPRGTLTAGKAAAVRKVIRVVGRRHYLIQKTIPLARYRERPYDFRVTVQRGGGGNWQVTGILGKVARKGSHVTNVARGGTVIPIEKLLKNSFGTISGPRNAIRSLSLNIARYLSTRLDRLADVGLDVGITRDGKPIFIELNGRDQRYGLRKAKLPDEYYRSFQTPLRYAHYLLGRTKSKRRR